MVIGITSRHYYSYDSKDDERENRIGRWMGPCNFGKLYESGRTLYALTDNPDRSCPICINTSLQQKRVQRVSDSTFAFYVDILFDFVEVWLWIKKKSRHI